MSNVNANINVFVDTKQAQAQIGALQAQITAFNKNVMASSGAATAQQAAMNKALMDSANASRMFTAKMVPVISSVDSFTNSLEKNKFSLGQYTKYAASQMPGMSRVFKREFDTINRVAESNVKRLQTQFTAAGNAANGMSRAIALTPVSLDKMSAGQAIANQRAMIFNRLMKDGSTSMLNWGKNTQWAGRQLMVGFTIPLGIFAGIAAKTFKELEAQSIAFKKVYGDIFTTPAEVEKNLSAVKELSLELTKYGIAVSKTMELANVAAQSGLRDADLIAATNEATRLAVLGQMEQAEAMQTVISMQTAFGQSNEELADSVNFLNIIENQTVLSLQDVAGAIPRVAPVIKGMGGDVKDLAVLLVAMKEGGVTAAEGANALKNSLARLITPTTAASKMAKGFGINLESMVSRNKGEVLPLILELAEAMKSLDGLDQQKLLSTVFGKYQFARIGTLMKNIVNDTSQARRAMDLMGMSTENLAKTAEDELSVVENSVSTKFTAAMERAKVAIAPIGEQFLKALTPILEFVSNIFDKFNSMPDGIKSAVAIFVGIIGGIAPVLLMTVGLIANLIANGLKFMNTLRGLSARLKGNGSQFQQMAIAEQEAAIASSSLEGRVGSLTGKMVMQQEAVATLIGLYSNLASAAAKAASSMPLAMGSPVARTGSRTGGGSVVSGPQSRSIVSRGYNKGVVKVPGTGNKDTIPALLTPGESVVTKEASQKYGAIISAMNAGTIKGFNAGLDNNLVFPTEGNETRVGVRTRSGFSVQEFQALADRAINNLVTSGQELSVAIDTVANKVVSAATQLGATVDGVSKTFSKKSAKEIFAEFEPPAQSYSQMQGNTTVRSHVEGLAPRTLIPNFVAALNSDTDIIRENARAVLGSTKAVELYRNGTDIFARELTESSIGFDRLQNALITSASGVTAGFTGTAMATPQGVNEVYNRMPAGIGEGDAMSLATFRQQVEYAENQIQELATRAGVAADALMDNPAIDNALDAAQQERVKNLTLLVKEGQAVALAQMSEEDFLRSRIKQIGLAIEAEKGQISATKANANAEAFATQQMNLLREAGVIATGATINYAKVMQVLATAAIGQAGAVVIGGEDVNQQFVKRGAQRLAPSAVAASDPARVSNLRSIPTATIPSRNPAFTASALDVNAERFTAAGFQAGGQFNEGVEESLGIQSPSVKAQEVVDQYTEGIEIGARGNVPEAKAAGRVVGNAFSEGIKATILSGGAVPPILSGLPQGTKLPGAGTGQVYNPSNNPQGLGVLASPIPVEPKKEMLAIESKEGKYARQQAEEDRLQKEQEKSRIVDKRRTNAVKEQIPLIGEENGYIKRTLKSIEQLERQRRLNLVAQEEERKAQLKLNAAKQREAIARETMNQRPARGGILDRPLGALRRVAFPNAQDSSLKNLGFNQFSGQVKTAGQLIVESAKEIRTKVSASIRNIPAEFKKSTDKFLQESKTAGAALKKDFVALGPTLKASLIRNVDRITSPAIKAAGALQKLGASAAQAGKGLLSGGVDAQGRSRGQRMAGQGNNAMMGLMGLSMAASFAGGAIGEMAQKIMPLTMGLMALQMVLPMLMSPLGIAIIAITALVGSLIWMRKSVDDVAKAAAKTGSNLGGAANRMEILQEATGFESPFMRAEDRMFKFNKKDKAGIAEFAGYFESESGKKFKEELKEMTSEEKYRKVASILAQGIANGMDPEKAKAFGQAISAEIGDAMLNAKLSRDFSNGIFKAGSRAAIDLVKQRQKESSVKIEEAPSMASSSISESLGTSGATNIWGETAATIAAGAGIGAAVGGAAGSAGFALGPLGLITAPLGAALGAVVGTVATSIPALINARNAMEQLNKNMETVALTFGSSIQILKEVTNAEQLLLEERRSGTISVEEYAKKSKELQKVEEEQANRLKQAITLAADPEATKQAISDQLIIGTGMEEGLAGAVARGVDRNTVSQKIFGEKFADLALQEQEVVSAAITETLTGLTPENAAEKLARIESDYAKIAEELVKAAQDGLTQAEFSQISEKEQVSKFAKDAFSGVSSSKAQELGFNTTIPGASAQDQLSSKISSNLMESKGAFDALGTSITEVSVALQGVSDVDVAAGIGEDSKKLQDFAEILVGLDGLSIAPATVFKMMTDESLNAEQAISRVKNVIEKVSKIKLDKKIFGRAILDAEALTQALLDAGVASDKIPGKIQKSVKEAATDIGNLSENAFNKLGNIKINASVVPTIFGEDAESASGVAALLKKSFPTGLPPATLPIFLSLMNTGVLSAISSLSPGAAEAIEKGATAGTVTTSGAGSSFPTTYTITPEDIKNKKAYDEFLELSEGYTGIDTGKDDPKDNDGGGGSEKQKPFKDFTASIFAEASLFTNLTKLLNGKYKNAKNALEKALKDPNFGFSGSLANEMRSAGLSEKLIADILSKGVDEATKIWGKLSEKMKGGATKINKTAKQLMKLSAVTDIGSAINDLKAQKAVDTGKVNLRKRLESQGFSAEDTEEIISNTDDALVLQLMSVGKNSKAWKAWASQIMASKAAAEALKDPLEKLQEEFDKAQDAFNAVKGVMDQGFDDAEQAKKDEFAAEFLKNNKMTVDSMQRQIELNQRLIDQEQDKIDKKQEEISDYQRTNDLVQQGIDDLKRQDDIRNRVSSALSYDLEQMGIAEQKIRDTYDERIKSLEKVESINQRITDQQKGQLNLSRALSEGDIYAAAQAVQEMRASDAQFAMQNTKDALQQSMENQVGALVSSEGKTREQIEAEIASIKEQSYQASLMIRIEEDKIYANNLEVRRLSNEIYNISEDMIEPLVNKNKEFERTLSYHAQEEAFAIKNLVLAGMTREEWNKKADALQRNIDNAEGLDPWLKALIGDYNALAKAANDYADAAARTGADVSAARGITAAPTIAPPEAAADNSSWEFIGGRPVFANSGGMIKKYSSGGSILGEGSRDSVSAMLTPGEFVVKKAMVDKYGIPMLSKINQGSFSMPRFNTGQAAPSEVSSGTTTNASINAPMYNNYSVNVSVSNSGASADEIANKTLMKIKQLQNTQIRSGRGF